MLRLGEPMLRSSARRLAILSSLLLLLPNFVAAQDSAAPNAPEHTEPGHATEEIVITASPLARSVEDLSQPVNVLSGDELLISTEPTLGETLAAEPGVSSSYFGPGSSRPIIRGLDADHIRVLRNGLGALDASAASADHAVTIDPLGIERIEVVRGPAALLYGPTAVGGVVNVIDNRIPDEPIDGVTGRLEGSLDSVDRGTNGAVVLEGGAGGFQIHTDGLAHRSRDLDIPSYARSSKLRGLEPLPPGEREEKNSLENSQIDTNASSIGISYAGERGFIGVAPSAFDTNYGTVAEKEVTIDMRERRWDFAGGLNDPVGGVENVRGKFALSDYQHIEFEGAEQGTVFERRAYEGRLEALHGAIGPVKGAVGGQLYRSLFSAKGEEAFLPPSKTTGYSAFVLEELQTRAVIFQFGGRLDWTNIRTESTAGFGPSQKRDRRTGSVSVGATWAIDDAYSLAASYAYTERPPLAQELFADGPHIATDAFEIGDPGLDVEKSLGLDLTLRKELGWLTGSVSGFYYEFDDFITLEATGANDPVDDLPIFQYVNLPATFLGGEAEVTVHLLETGDHSLHLDLRADYVRARDRDTGDPLPRIPPFRFGAELAYHTGGLHASAGVTHAASQNRTADYELSTDAYTLLDASVSYELPVRATTVVFFVHGSNLANQTARNSASFLKDVAPLPGRGVRGGVRLSF
jgi:iron complex outermembrane receptor protein